MQSRNTEKVVEVSYKEDTPDWILEDMPTFFDDVAAAERYLDDIDTQLVQISPLAEEAMKWKSLGVDSHLYAFIAVKRKLLQQYAIVQNSIAKHEGCRINEAYTIAYRVNMLQQQVDSLRAQLKEERTARHNLKDEFVKIIDARDRKLIKQERRLDNEVKFLARAIYALVENPHLMPDIKGELKFIPESLAKGDKFGSAFNQED